MRCPSLFERLPGLSSQSHCGTVSLLYLCFSGSHRSSERLQLACREPGWQSGTVGYSGCGISPHPLFKIATKSTWYPFYRERRAKATDHRSSILTANRGLFLNGGLCFIAFTVVTALLGALNTAETILILYHIQWCYVHQHWHAVLKRSCLAARKCWMY